MAPRTAGQQAAQLIRERILSGALAPGAPLNQKDLASALGMSRIPIRDALRTLASEGLIQMRAHATAVVSNLGVSDLRDLYELRLALEPALCRAAVHQLQREDLSEMERWLDTMVTASDSDTWLNANNRFHEVLYRRAARPRAIEIIDQARTATDRYTRIYHQLASPTVESEHRMILDAATSRQERRLEALIVAHLSDGFEAMLTYVDEREQTNAGQPNDAPGLMIGAGQTRRERKEA